jgi:hypothetical protein
LTDFNTVEETKIVLNDQIAAVMLQQKAPYDVFSLVCDI